MSSEPTTDGDPGKHFAPPKPAVVAEAGSTTANTIHGVAIGAGDVTRGRSKQRKLWPAQTLRDAAESLAGRPLVRDHENTVDGSVGRVLDARYKENVGVLYRAELNDEALLEKVKAGQLEVSPRIVHTPVAELDRDDATDAFVIDRAVFDNLSLVISGAAESNTVEYGDTSELSDTELLSAFDASGTTDADTDTDTDGGVGGSDGDSPDEPTADQTDTIEETVDDDEPTEGDSDDESTEQITNDDGGDDSDDRMTVVPVVPSLTNTTSNTLMRELTLDSSALPDGADNINEPVVVERSELTDLKSAAEAEGDEYEELRDQMERFGDAAEERDQLQARVEELEEYEERLEEVDEMRQVIASDLADEIDHFDAEELAERYSVSELREKLDSVTESADDEVEADDNESEELDDDPEAGADDPNPAPRGGTDNEVDELIDEDQERVADLEDTIAWYRDHNWDSAAEELEEELDDIRN